jgi:hypothetical protein
MRSGLKPGSASKSGVVPADRSGNPYIARYDSPAAARRLQRRRAGERRCMLAAGGDEAGKGFLPEPDGGFDFTGGNRGV